jgi:hypothetical protein
LQYFGCLDRQQLKMKTPNRSRVGICSCLILLALSATPISHAAERGLEKVRIAVSSKSLGFLDTWPAKERGFYRKHGIDAEIIAMRLDEDVALESHAIYARLLIEDARPLAAAVKTVLDQQGKPDLPLDRVVDATIIEEVLRERR